jgi:hypothetical protein
MDAMSAEDARGRRPILPRWSPVGIGIGNVAIALVVHAISGSRPAAVTFAVILVASTAGYAVHVRAGRRRPARVPEPPGSLAPLSMAQEPAPEDHFEIVETRERG